MKSVEKLKLWLSVRGVRTMLVVDVLSIAAFFVTLALILRFAENKLSQQADWIAKDHAKDIRRSIDNSLSSFILTSDAFVSGYIEDYETVQDGDRSFSRFSASESELKKHYNLQGLKEVVKTGLEFIPDCSDIVLVYEPGVLPGAPERGIASVLYRDSDEYQDLLGKYEIFNSKLYRRGRELGHSYLTNVSKVSKDSILVITYVVPLFSKENGRMLGQFWFDIRLDDITSMISSLDMPYDSTYVVLVDETERIVASDHQNLNGLTLKKWVRWANYGVDNDEEYQFLVNALGAVDNELSFGSTDGQEYRLYHSYLPSLNFTLFTLILNSSVYSDITGIKNTLLLVSILGILLMIICTWYAFVSFSKAARAKMQADSEFALATEIQTSYLPKTVPSVAGIELAHRYVSAKEVGGDLYDFVQRDGKLFFCVGDVSGKGVPAAMLMAVITHQFHNTVRYKDNPRDVMTILNDSLAERADAMMFCTMIIGVYDPSTRVLTCCNAGHPRPVRLTQSDAMFVDFKTNVPIGLFSGFEYENDSVTMSPGESLLLYTDGITEARSLSLGFYGEERLMSAVKNLGTCTPTQIIDTLTGTVAEFQSGAGQADDIAAVCLKFN